MIDQVRPTTVSNSEKIITDILTSAFTQLAQQVAKSVHMTLDLPIVDETQKRAIESDVAKANEKLARINETIATKEASLLAMSQTLLDSVTPTPTHVTIAKTRNELAELSTSRMAEIILSTTHYSEIAEIESLVSHNLAKRPEIKEAIFLRAQREIASNSLNRILSILSDETTPIDQKGLLIAAIERSKSELEKIDETIRTRLIALKNQY